MTHFDRKTYVASFFMRAWFSADYDFQTKIFFFPKTGTHKTKGKFEQFWDVKGIASAKTCS
jgi:hypothetical protein